jgi:hypothetical protein
MNKEQLKNNAEQSKRDAEHRTNTGVTLIELVMAMATASMVMVAAALLVHSGYRSWNRTFRNAYGDVRLDAIDTMATLGAIGRKSNKANYCVYDVVDGTFSPVLPSVEPEEIVTGNAVELRYWDTELNDDLLDPATTATAYALFYPENGQLKLDFGPYPPGAIDSSGHRRTTDVTTRTMAKNVANIEFSHTTRNMAGDGKGCVRMKLTTTDPADGSSKTFMAATLMRNVWPQ